MNDWKDTNSGEMRGFAEEVKNNLVTLINQGLFDEAKEIMNKYEAIMSNDPDIFSLKSIILIKEGDLREAEKVLKKGLQIASDNIDMLYNLGYVYENLEQYPKALNCYSIIKRLSDDSEILAEINSIIESIKGKMTERLYINRPRLAFFVKQGMDSFLGHIIEGLSRDYETKKVVVTDLSQIERNMRWADICWFEWCDELIIYASKLEIAREKKIICRLHSYEAFTYFPTQVHWEYVDRVIFVAEHIRDIVIEGNNRALIIDKTCVIPNGVDTTKFDFKERKPGFNIAYVGYINYKKGPMLLLHTFKALYDKDKRYKLFIAGEFQDKRYELYFRQMAEQMGIEKNIILEGWQKDINAWLGDKSYLLLTSLLEGNPLCVLEAMSKGIKPIIHNFVGASKLYPSNFIWNTIDDAVKMVTAEEYSSKVYREYVCENFSSDKQMELINNIVSKLASLKKCARDKEHISGINRIQQYYDEFLEYLKKDRIRPNPRHEYIRNRLNQLIEPNDNVLDLGCGIGITTEHIMSLGVSKVIGVDLSPELIKYARETVKGATFIQKDITQLDLNEKFDKICLVDVMEHIPRENYMKLFAVIKKHVKEHGLIFVTIPDPNYLDMVRKNNPSALQIIDNSITYDEMNELCKENGLQIKSFQIYGIDCPDQYNEYCIVNKQG